MRSARQHGCPWNNERCLALPPVIDKRRWRGGCGNNAGAVVAVQPKFHCKNKCLYHNQRGFIAG